MGATSSASDWLKAVGTLTVVVFWLVVLWALVGSCDDDSGTAATTTTRTTTTTKQPYPHQTMPDNGTYPMGGVDGKDWGIYETRVPVDSPGCRWSANGVNPNRPGEEFFSGEGQPGEHLRVILRPDDYDDVSSITGEMKGGWRVVFITNGCGTWTLERSN